jgi:hypothetical protein
MIAVNAGSWGPLCNAARKEIKRGYRIEAESRGDNLQYMKKKFLDYQGMEKSLTRQRKKFLDY